MIGFKDGPKPCGFIIKLTRGDGSPVTDAMGMTAYVIDSQGNWPTVSSTYDSDADPGTWNIRFTDEGYSIDPDGYWVFYSCGAYGIPTQYPGRYKSADFLKTADLIPPGEYEDTIPYWKSTVTLNKPTHPLSEYDLDTPFIYTLHLESSVPYKIYGNYYADVGSVVALGQITIPLGWYWGTYPGINGVGDGIPRNVNPENVGGYSAYTISGIGGDITIKQADSVSVGGILVASGPCGPVSYSVTVTDASIFGETAPTWREVDGVIETSSVEVVAFTQPTWAKILLGLGPSYDW